MLSTRNDSKFNQLREIYPVFTFEGYFYTLKQGNLHIRYHFHLDDKIAFYPRYEFPLPVKSLDQIPENCLSNLVFHLGMVEVISYWKATCSPVLHIKPFKLTPNQQAFWKKLFYKGLGEFLHLNKIDVSEKDLLGFSFEKAGEETPGVFFNGRSDEVLIPIGGGKDSLVTLNILTQTYTHPMAMAINPVQATRESVKMAGLDKQFYVIQRHLDPTLLELNQKGFLNGHTPFSSLLAFVSLLVSAFTGRNLVALSNEDSANEATIPGTDINHQYSKSYEFEQDFRNYVKRYISREISYFSFLRPLNELQIAALFARNSRYFEVFRSCNVGSKTNSWCCNCPKCLFTYIMLSAFVDEQRMVQIFGEKLFEKTSLMPLLMQLAGLTEEKPFECVGTIEEVSAALNYLINSKPPAQLPALLRDYQEKVQGVRFNSLEQQLQKWNGEHFLRDDHEKILKQALEQLK